MTADSARCVARVRRYTGSRFPKASRCEKPRRGGGMVTCWSHRAQEPEKWLNAAEQHEGEPEREPDRFSRCDAVISRERADRFSLCETCDPDSELTTP